MMASRKHVMDAYKEGKITQFVELTQDVTESKKAENALKKAYKELGLSYSKDLKTLHDPVKEFTKLPPAEIWHADKGIITYKNIKAMLADAKKFRAAGKLRASYVYDNSTGLKLFGKVAFYVADKKGMLTSFMRKPDADAFAGKTGGIVTQIEGAMKFAAGEPIKVAMQ